MKTEDTSPAAESYETAVNTKTPTDVSIDTDIIVTQAMVAKIVSSEPALRQELVEAHLEKSQAGEHEEENTSDK